MKKHCKYKAVPQERSEDLRQVKSESE